MTRRSVLGAAGAGAAGLAAGALVSGGPALAAARRTAAGKTAAGPDEKGAGEPIVVHLKDARTGELDVYRGTSHTRVRDRDLAARLMGTVR